LNEKSRQDTGKPYAFAFLKEKQLMPYHPTRRWFYPVLVKALIFSILAVLYAGSEIFSAQDGAGSVISGKKDSVKGSVLKPEDLTYTIHSINYKMIYIPPGSFTMGSPPTETGPPDKRLLPGRHRSDPGAMGRDHGHQPPSHFKECGTDCPVEQISWNDCQEFVIRLNRKEKTRRYRLPTEAEWEYACRAGNNQAFANGDISHTGCGHDPVLDKIGWYCGNTEEKTQPVAKKIPNAWGLYDMHGNTWEWCQDWYGPYTIGHVLDPKGADTGVSRVFRGGGWGLNARSCRCAFRDKYDPKLKCRLLGFRLARDVE